MLWFLEEEEKNSDQEKEQSMEMGDEREKEPGQAWKPRVCRKPQSMSGNGPKRSLAKSPVQWSGSGRVNGGN